MKRKTPHSRIHRLVAVTTASLLFTLATNLWASEKFNINIESKLAGSALLDLAEQSGTQIVLPHDAGRRITVPALNGKYTLAEALDLMLAGTGLEYEFTSDDSVLVKSGAKKKSQTARQSAVIDEIIIEEIIVTATKRKASLQDTAMSISAVGSEQIGKKGLVGMSDYLRTLPGVNMIDRGPGRNNVVIRGISSETEYEGFANGPTVGIYLGDLPLSTIGRFGAADIKMVDIERVEVLRGPQGSLYGSGSLAGTVRYIPNAPNLTEIEGNVSAEYSITGKKGGNNTMIQGVLNVPIVEDQLALRAVVYNFDNSGYVENVAGSDPDTLAIASNFGAERLAFNESEVGGDENQGARISFLWQPLDNLSIDFTHLAQDLEQNGIAEVELNLRDYEQTRYQLGDDIGGSELLRNDVDISSLKVEYDLGWASLVSASSWMKEDSLRNRNLESIVGFLPVPQTDDLATETFVQELRLVSQFEGPLQFIAGYYYEDVEIDHSEKVFWAGDATNPFDPSGPDLVFDFRRGEFIRQNAFFGEISYQVIEQLTLTVGARAFDYDRRQTQVTSGFFAGADPSDPSISDLESDDSGTTYKFNVSYTPNDDSLLYLQWAEGFRLGRPVPPVPASLCDVNPADGIFDGTNLPIDADSTAPDTVESVEVGGKFTFLNSRLTVNASAFHNEWSMFPVSVVGECGLAIQANAGDAATRGLELESTFYVTDGFSIDIGLSLVNAELTKDAPGIGGADGDRLPGSPERTYNIGLQYEFDWLGYPLYVRSDYAYVDEFYNNLKEAGEHAGDYQQVNFRTGITLDRVNASVFVNNLLDENAITWLDSTQIGSADRLKPRTIGLNVGYSF